MMMMMITVMTMNNWHFTWKPTYINVIGLCNGDTVPFEVQAEAEERVDHNVTVEHDEL
jgi:hypothetical protein